jgi:phosphoribosylformylglycinamidine cyclo-ligase
VISGFVRACKENSCSLIGGETAEMPGLYRDGEFDIAGTIVGVVDKKKIVDGKRIKAGNVLIGLPSTGLHTNGYSLARKVLLPRYSLQKHVRELNNSLDKILLAVHRSYLSPIQHLVAKEIVHGMSHITGGGIVGNTMRVIPRGLKLSVDWDSWERPAIFSLIQEKGNVPEDEMRRTFNLGIGMIFVVERQDANIALRILRRRKEHPIVMGEVTHVTQNANIIATKSQSH